MTLRIYSLAVPRNAIEIGRRDGDVLLRARFALFEWKYDGTGVGGACLQNDHVAIFSFVQGRLKISTRLYCDG